MQTYKDLLVWQKGIALTKEIYLLASKLPKTETYALADQMRRASVSIPANLAEGYARKHRAEYVQFTRIAFGSGAELETYLVLVEELNFLTSSDLIKAKGLLDETMRMLNKLISSLTSRP